MISEYEHDLSVRHMLSSWRSDAGITQEEMGKYLGISRRKIQMIENGECHVKSYTIVQWADITGHDPVLCMQQIIHPLDSFTGPSIEKKRKKFSSSLEICHEDELDALSEIFLNDHGGDRRALAHLMASYVQLDPGDRQNIALLIINCFKNMVRKRKPNFMPDIEFISAVRDKAVEAHINGMNRYF